MNPLAWIDDELRALASRGLLRELPAPIAHAAPIVDVGGRRLVSFASNDYLGLAGDPRLTAAAIDACRAAGVGRGASPLVCGRSHQHVELERRLAEFENTEAALLFPSGFAANTGVVPALADRGDAIYADAKNHASLIDGCRLSRAETHVYPHADVDALAALLATSGQFRRRLVVTDSLFSMDGDLAPLAAIADLARQHDAMLVVDEAHATGVFGAQGRGACEHFGIDEAAPVSMLLHLPPGEGRGEGEPSHEVPPHPALSRRERVSLGVIRIGTLSKALGSAGGFVCGSRQLIQWLANRARSYVFSTAQPAANAAAALAALDIVQAEPGRRGRLLETAAWLRNELASRGWNTGASASQIIPLIVGSPGRAVELNQSLAKRGYWLPAIRPPSVPPGESLLRLSLTAAHTPEMLEGLLAGLDAVKHAV